MKINKQNIDYNCNSLEILPQKIQQMMNINYLAMQEESQRIASEQQEYTAIVSDRYEQEMKKAVSNIKYKVEKAELPYLGLDLAPIIDESLAVVDVSK